MVKPVVMCRWTWDDEKKETVKSVLGYLPGEFDADGLLIRVLPDHFSIPVATPELAMELVNEKTTSPSQTFTASDYLG